MKQMYYLVSLGYAVRGYIITTVCVLFFFTQGKAQAITADFTNDAIPCGTANVNFAATVTGAIPLSDLRFDWDFGDGKPTRSGQNISNGFPVTPGATHLVFPSPLEIPFQVKLTVFRISTGLQVATVTKPVIVRPAPVADLIDVNNPLKPFDNCSNNPTIQSPFFTVTVGNQSIDPNTITGYTIDWGDGTAIQPFVRADFPVTHIYGRLGLFKLKFSATGQNGCTASKTYNVKNQGNPAIGISTGGNTTGCAPITFAFRINRVYNNDPETSYVWDFGDGTTMNWTTDSINRNDSMIFHTFTRSSCDQVNGSYVVKVTATNACQSTEASVGGVRVGTKPQPAFTASNLCEGEAVVFQNNTLPGLNFDCTKSVIFKWDFGDGSPSVITTGNADIPHTFPASSNEYLVRLIAINDCKDSAYAAQTITLTRKPVAIATLTPLQGCSPLAVNAVNTSTGDIKSTLWRVAPATGWSFTGGTNANSINPKFLFTVKGNYIVTLEIKNDCVVVDKDFNVFVNGPLDVTFPNIANQCNSYTFDASMPSVFQINPITNELVQANWTVTPATGYTFLNGSNAQSLFPQIRFTQEGDYTIKVNLKNGCDSLSISKSFRFSFSPTANAVDSISQGCIPFKTYFTNHSTGYLAVSTWSVTPAAGTSFVNGTTAASLNPNIQFTQAGNYTVKLTTTNACGTNTLSFPIKAQDIPTANLLPLPDICENANLTINSALLNVITNNGSAPIYDWTVTPNTGVSYQNGTFSNSANPSLQFTIAGSYQISVTVSNGCGSVVKTQTLNVRPAVQLITSISDTSGCAPKTISFTDNSTGDQLTHKWTVLPATGFSYATGSSTSASPSLLFTAAGIYTITHTLTGLCSTQSKTYTVSISTLPTINLSPIANQCAMPFALLIDSTKLSINQNGKALSSIRWGTTPATGVTFIDGTNENSQYPHLQFNNTGQYTLWVETINDCGKTTASRAFWVLAHAAEKTVSTASIGCAPLKVSYTDQSQGDLLVHNWSVSPASGFNITPSSASASPDIVFTKAGIYTVTHKVSNFCGSDSHTYTVKAKEPPIVVLSLPSNSCNSFTLTSDLQNTVLTPNQNDTIRFRWTVTPNQGVTYLSNTSDTSRFPVIQIADTGVYKVTVRATGECGFNESSQSVSISTDPGNTLIPLLSTPCIPADLTFIGQAFGQNLVYDWTITPLAGVTFTGGTTSASAHPQIRFNTPGKYSVSLNMNNYCGNDTKKWDFTIVDKPTLLFNKVADTCDNFTFLAERYVNIQDNGNAVKSYNWTVSPATGFSYIDGTSSSSAFPHIFFNAANAYTLTMNATNDCGTTSASQSFTLDQFIQGVVGADTVLCTNNNLYPLSGIPAGGSWSILPASASGLLKVVGNTYWLDLSVPGNYVLTYKRGNSYCASQAIRRITIMALPVVNAGIDFTVCENDQKPVALNGNPAGGTWSGSGITGNTFSTTGLPNGSYILKYTWTDPVTSCPNTDQLVARLLPVPSTGFTIGNQVCKGMPLLFTPNGPPGTMYSWNFGDGQTATSSGAISHIYLTGGVFTAAMISADPNNCSVSSSQNLMVLDDITLPIITVNPKSGCGPLTVTYTSDTTAATGNGQSYSWNFGNGQTLNGPFTSKQVIYNPGFGDTTYNAVLTISNKCSSRTVNYPVTVNALPHANFVMPHDWECSPATVQFKNLTADRKATFYWDFGDGTTSTDVQPSHAFSTGTIARTFLIKLVAGNGCGKDTISRPLLIKPNSIEAFIQMNTRQACPGEPVTFTNFSTDTVTKIMNYYWDFGDGTIANTWNATHAYTTEGKYTVKLFVDNGCSYSEKTDLIEILPPLILSIACRDSICLGDTLNLTANSSLGVLINTKWDFGDSYFGTGQKTNHLYTTTGWKNISFSAASAASMTHCSGNAVKRVYVKDTPISLPLKDIEGCAPISLALKKAGIDKQLWNFGEDSVWTSSGIYTYNNTGYKPIRKKVSQLTENAMGCRTMTSFWVTIYPNPVARIRVTSNGGSPENVYVTSLSTNTTACQWLFPDGTSAQGCDSVLIRLYTNGFYKISLRSSNQYGCTDTTSVVHQTIIKGLFVPNAFQPNNTSKEVNIFKPVGIGLQSYYLGVFDTWGNPIWETNKLIDSQPAEGWDGRTNTGKELPIDAYIWRIKAVFIDGTTWKGMKGRDGTLRTEGTVTLIK